MIAQKKASEMAHSHLMTPIAKTKGITSSGLSRKINFSSSDLLMKSHDKLKTVENLTRETSDFK